MRELRIDKITNDKVIVAEDRLNRPSDKISNDEVDFFSDDNKGSCPFCRGNEGPCGKETFRIEDSENWLVKSVQNKFPIIDNISEDIYGEHEVMIDTYRHSGNFYNMSYDEFENLFKMYQNRYKEFVKNNNVEYVSIFKNFLRKAGASLAHPHSQIISLSFIPPEVENEILVAKDYYEKNNKCLYESIIEEEERLNERVVYNGNSFLALIPYATKYTGEVRIIFKEKIGFEQLKEDSIKELSKLFKSLFKKIEKVEGKMPFNLYIHTYPTNTKDKSYFNTHIHIIPRKYSFGGFELCTGVYVSSVKPESLASKLKIKDKN